jgi:hypothetical protein
MVLPKKTLIMSVVRNFRRSWDLGQFSGPLGDFYLGSSSVVPRWLGVSVPKEFNKLCRSHSNKGVQTAMWKLLLTLAFAFVFPIGALAQAALSPCTPPGGSGAQSQAISRIGVGTPYTLTAIIKSDMVSTEGVKTDGGVATSFQARDSEGRTRVDDPRGCFLQNGQPHWEGYVSVNDPVANTFTSWRVAESLSPQRAYANHLAHVKNEAVKEVEPSTAQQEFDRARLLSEASDHDPDTKSHIHYKVEDLGKRTIVGLEASGMRITKTFPAGILNNTSAAGLPINQRPYTEVEERWTSDQYRMILLNITNNEATGTSSYEVTSFTPGEPDASLFQPPAGYSIQAQ